MKLLIHLLYEALIDKNFLTNYLKADKKYQKRYLKFRKFTANVEEGIKEGRIIFYNSKLVAETIFNVNYKKSSLDLVDFIGKKYC